MLNVSLVGNPNTGKTTLFNSLTRANEHVGNWHGVTVEEKTKEYAFEGEKISITDLPGIYSLSPLSFEEEVAVKYLLNHSDDVVLNICDASNLKRNLYLSLSLLELGVKMVLVINQVDKKPLYTIDVAALSSLLGVEVVYINAADRHDMSKVSSALLRAAQSEKKYSLPYLSKLNISATREYITENNYKLFYSIKLLEDDEFVKKKFAVSHRFGKMEEVACARYEYIDNVLNQVTGKTRRVYGQSKLDRVFINRFLALPCFVCFVAIAFYLTFFSVGAFLSDALGKLIDLCFSPINSYLVAALGNQHWVVGLFENAIVGGIGSVVSFLPQVALLFLFLSILEDSGYLARIAFLFDDVLSKVGLSGKAIYTLLMGFGCSASAVLTARNMEDKNSKIKTALLTPYMSCSAKFPIYSVLGGAFFGVRNMWVILLLYFLGVIIAVLISSILDKTLLRSRAQSFVLEFPPYRMIGVKRAGKLVWQNIKLFLGRVGSIILAMNVIVWVLSNFTITMSYVPNGSGVSILETLGRLLAPIFIPLGFGNWAIVASLLAGLVAKEVVVSSIAMFNGAEGVNVGASILSLSAVAGFASASSLLSFLVFCLLYMPCLATIAVLCKEIGAKWTFLSVLIELAVAYVVSFVVFNAASACELFGTGKVLGTIIGIAVFMIAVIYVCGKIKKRKNCPYGKICQKKCNKK